MAGKTEPLPDEAGVRILVRFRGEEQLRSAYCVQAFDSGKQGFIPKSARNEGREPFDKLRAGSGSPGTAAEQ